MVRRPVSSICREDTVHLATQVETWLPVIGFEGLYEVSHHGQVRSLDHQVTQNSRWGLQSRIQRGRLLRPKRCKGGYLQVCLYRAGVPCYRHIAHIVAEAFIGLRPAGQQVCHCNGVKTDNRACNLRYDTIKGNVADKVVRGTLLRGENHYNAKASEEVVRALRAQGKDRSWAQLAEQYGFSKGNVRSILTFKTWRHV
jgi:hypothetical protein